MHVGPDSGHVSINGGSFGIKGELPRFLDGKAGELVVIRRVGQESVDVADQKGSIDEADVQYTNSSVSEANGSRQMGVFLRVSWNW